METLPPVGLGTMGLDTAATATAITTAIGLGYRHVDTAQIYGNERLVGDAIAEADVDRDDLTLATKVWADTLAPADVRASTEESARKLGVDAIDLLYVHRPIDTYDPDETLPAFDALRDGGTIRRIGVSNFTVAELDEAREILDAPLFAHQTELHPLFYRPELVRHAQRHDYTVVAYSPIAGGRVGDLPELRAVAEKHETTPEAVSIAWLCGKENVVTIPKSSTEAHLRANFEAASLALDDEDVARIESIDEEEELFPE
ncbi:aldo/keto reductase [Haloferacaceae archaeon DSL9]